MTISNQDWYALYVRSRHEFIAEEDLRKKGVETFLPSVTRLRSWKDRKKEVAFPLFPGYLFVSIARHAEAFLRVVTARGSVTLVCLEPGHPTPVSPEEIRSLKRLMDSGEPIDVYTELREGVRVRVKRGPLAGAEGVLGKKEGRHEFLVNIDLLGRSVGVVIHTTDVEPV